MKKTLLLNSLLIFCFYFLNAQVTYQKVYNSLKGYNFSTTNISSVTGNNVLVTSAKALSNNTTIQAVYMVDENGNPKWTRYFVDSAWALVANKSIGVQVDKKSSIVFRVQENDSAILMLKLDRNGNKIWSKELRGAGARLGGLGDVKPDGAGNIILGSSIRVYENNAYITLPAIIKLNGITGDVIWIKTLNAYASVVNDGGESVGAIAITKDKGFTVAFLSDIGNYPNYNRGFLLAKYDTNGNVQWTQRYRINSDQEYPYHSISDIITTLDGGYAFTGSVRSSASIGVDDVFVIKTDSVGAIKWAKQIDNGDFEKGVSMVKNPDSSIVISGGGGASVYEHPFIMSMNKNGAVNWYHKISSELQSINYNGNFYGFIKTKDGGYLTSCEYIAEGQGKQSICLLKFDDAGNNCNALVIDTVTVSNVPRVISPYSVELKDYSGSVVVNQASVNEVSGGFSVTTLCESSAATASALSEDKVVITTKAEIKIYPNPVVNNYLQLSLGKMAEKNVLLSVYDIAGRKVYEEKLYNLSFKTINVAKLTAGSYILTVNNNGKLSSVKFVKQ